MNGTAASLFVTVGTDHHPFDRLVAAVDDWLAGHPQVAARMQVGTAARPPTTAPWDRQLPYEVLRSHLESADLVVCHGGPATIMDARACGRLPVVVPRDPARGEHVDDHQLRFARQLGAAGQIVLAEDAVALRGALDDALAAPASLHLPRRPRGGTAAAARITAITTRLVALPDRPRTLLPRARTLQR